MAISTAAKRFAEKLDSATSDAEKKGLIETLKALRHPKAKPQEAVIEPKP